MRLHPFLMRRLFDQSARSFSDAHNYRSLQAAGAALTTLLLMMLVFHHTPSLNNQWTIREIFHWFLVFGLIASYVKGYLALLALPASPQMRRLIVNFAGAFLLISVLTNAFQSIDVRCYVNLGWTQTHYHLNPYTVTVSQIPGWREDPMFYPEWVYNPAAYGFLFSWLASGICMAAKGNYWVSILLFKLMNAGAAALTALVLWRGCKRLNLTNPEHALYLFLWSPLLLIHGVANAHNDILMAFFTIAGLYLAIRGNWLFVLPTLMLGVLIKYGSARHPAVRVSLPGKKKWLGTCCGQSDGGHGSHGGLLVALSFTSSRFRAICGKHGQHASFHSLPDFLSLRSFSNLVAFFQTQCRSHRKRNPCFFLDRIYSLRPLDRVETVPEARLFTADFLERLPSHPVRPDLHRQFKVLHVVSVHDFPSLPVAAFR